MVDISIYKDKIKNNLPLIKEKINNVLNGEDLQEIEHILKRIDSSGDFPHWFEKLKIDGSLPNLDGKTVGSVLEKIIVCIIEKYVLDEEIELSLNPARGVDIPDLELGVKSPSENFDTSEPYFSAYERLLGNEYDAVIMLTNYQTAKSLTPFKLQILKIKYLNGTEIADKNLCTIAKELRNMDIDETSLKKLVRFLAYVNKSDWEANKILKLIQNVMINKGEIEKELTNIFKDFISKNNKNKMKFKPLIPEDSLERLMAITDINPIEQGIIKAADDWVIITQKDNGRLPNENEWNRFINGPLDGKISLSFALQWRYNFRSLFN